jgi:hypothetical protein
MAFQQLLPIRKHFALLGVDVENILLDLCRVCCKKLNATNIVLPHLATTFKMVAKTYLEGIDFTQH